MTKNEIRAMIRAEKKKLSHAEILEYSEKLCDILANEPVYKNTKAIYPYIAYNQEIITTPLIRRAWQDNKRVAVPKCFSKELMEFIYIDSFSTLSPGCCGIPEPADGKIAEDSEALIIMPGLAFGRDFNRIGYGGGYYDRYLAQNSHRKLTTLALAYEFQLFDSLEAEAHDYRVDAIITASYRLYSPEPHTGDR